MYEFLRRGKFVCAEAFCAQGPDYLSPGNSWIQTVEASHGSFTYLVQQFKRLDQRNFGKRQEPDVNGSISNFPMHESLPATPLTLINIRFLDRNCSRSYSPRGWNVPIDICKERADKFRRRK